VPPPGPQSSGQVGQDDASALPQGIQGVMTENGFVPTANTGQDQAGPTDSSADLADLAAAGLVAAATVDARRWVPARARSTDVAAMEVRSTSSSSRTTSS